MTYYDDDNDNTLYQEMDPSTKQVRAETVPELVERLTRETKELANHIDIKAKYLHERHALILKLEALEPYAEANFKAMVNKLDYLQKIARYGELGRMSVSDIKDRLRDLEAIQAIEIVITEDGVARRATMKEVRSRLRHLQKIKAVEDSNHAAADEGDDVAEAD
jgi:hypothetical protein